MISDEQAELILAKCNSQRRSQRLSRISSYILSGLVKCACSASLEGNGVYIVAVRDVVIAALSKKLLN